MSFFSLHRFLGLAAALTYITPKGTYLDVLMGVVGLFVFGFLNQKALLWLALGEVAHSKPLEGGEIKNWLLSKGYTQVFKIDRDGINAYAFSFKEEGPRFYITKGALRLPLEQQMALMAHEIAHVEENHFNKIKIFDAWADVFWFAFLMGTAFVWRTYAPAYNEKQFDESVIIWNNLWILWWLASFARSEAVLWFRRRCEFEADKKMLKDADGKWMLSLMFKLMGEPKANLGRREDFFWGASHPPLEARAKRILNTMSTEVKGL